MATGQQKHFEWRQLAVTAFSTYVNVGINQGIPSSHIESIFLKEFTDTELEMAAYGQEANPATAAARALGTAMGQYAGNSLVNSWERSKAQAQATKTVLTRASQEQAATQSPQTRDTQSPYAQKAPSTTQRQQKQRTMSARQDNWAAAQQARTASSADTASSTTGQSSWAESYLKTHPGLTKGLGYTVSEL